MKRRKTGNIPPAFISGAVLCDTRLTHCAKLILGVITTLCHGKGPSWVSNKTLAAWVGVKTPRAVRMALKELESLGYLKRKTSGRKRWISIAGGTQRIVHSEESSADMEE